MTDRIKELMQRARGKAKPEGPFPELPRRVRNALEHIKVTTDLELLAAVDNATIGSVRGIGKRGVMDVCTYLAKKFPEDPKL